MRQRRIGGRRQIIMEKRESCSMDIQKAERADACNIEGKKKFDTKALEGAESSKDTSYMTRIQMSETILIGSLLALAGGFLDAYTYICRGGVFANAQTGNIVLFSMHLCQMEWERALTSAIPIIAFAAGIMMTEAVRRRQKTAGFLHWRQGMLLLEIAIITVAMFIPHGHLDPVVNIMIAFVCSLQVHSFRRVHGHGVASTMCTGNLRSGTEALYCYIETKDPYYRHKYRCYYGVILAFIAGAVGGTAASNHFPEWALICPVIIYMITFVIMIKEDGGMVEHYGRKQ